MADLIKIEDFKQLNVNSIDFERQFDLDKLAYLSSLSGFWKFSICHRILYGNLIDLKMTTTFFIKNIHLDRLFYHGMLFEIDINAEDIISAQRIIDVELKVFLGDGIFDAIDTFLKNNSFSLE